MITVKIYFNDGSKILTFQDEKQLKFYTDNNIKWERC